MIDKTTHLPQRLYREIEEDIVPMKPAKPELTFGEPKKWNITGTSTPLLQMFMIRTNFLRFSSFNLFLTSAL